MKLCILNVLLLCIIGTQFVSGAGTGCPGCPTEGDVNDKTALQLLDKVVVQQNKASNALPLKVVKVTKVTKQVVAGTKYVVDFDAESERTKEQKKCHATILYQPWVTEEPKTLEFKCDN